MNKLLVKIIKLFLKYFTEFIFLIIIDYILAEKTKFNFLSLASSSYSVPPQVINELNSYYSTSQSVLNGIFNYLSQVLRGNLGYSIYYSSPVSDIIARSLPLSLLEIGEAYVISLPLVYLLLLYQFKFIDTLRDSIFTILFTVIASTPEILLAILFLKFFHYFSSIGIPQALILSAIMISNSYLILKRLIPNILIEYDGLIKYKISAGFTSKKIVKKDLIILLLPTFLYYIAVNFVISLQALIFIEPIFNYPGLGYFLYYAVSFSDYPLASGIFMIISLLSLISLFMTNVLSELIDWRLKAK